MTTLNCKNTVVELQEWIENNQVSIKVLEMRYDKEASKPEPDPEKLESFIERIEIKKNNIRLFTDEIKSRV